MNDKFYMYKGYPLVRKGNELYYGYMSDPFVIWIQITDTKEDSSAKKVRVTQMATKVSDPMKAFVKNTEKECGLYEALDIANVWLEKALSN
ncbi:MAG: hypothetical protein IKS13_07620 [Ruminococcus sp.]|nr:hypothetical protein [Ruminococcus sp.]MBQ3947107.1 hypothetical protein [Ruminococcus sp.]MBR6394664.1 hypothetical protein [Ruminococcus sp.]MCR5729258.1 hypothetical protein [Ruminococcus sp.]